MQTKPNTKRITTDLKAPFPWFGGKRKVAGLIWKRLGDTPNYVEPFAGSLATLLARPHEPRAETVNDIDCYIANFWRAMAHDPEKLARHADWPVSEADLHARHLWLVNREEFRERMKTDPDHFDVRVAGWWVWGISQWIGGEWCKQPQWRGRYDVSKRRGISAGRVISTEGENRFHWRKRPVLRRGGHGVHRKIPMLKKGRVGVHANKGVERRRPHLSSDLGVHRQKPDISGNRGAYGRGVHACGLPNLLEYFEALAIRLRRVRICCGDWSRIVSPSATWKIGVTGVLLDPPYPGDCDRDRGIYAEEDLDVWHAVKDWAVKNGDNPKLRIALCGYEGKHGIPHNWETVAWETGGGYGNQAEGGRGKANGKRERIWFSPHCLKQDQQGELFGA